MPVSHSASLSWGIQGDGMAIWASSRGEMLEESWRTCQAGTRQSASSRRVSTLPSLKLAELSPETASVLHLRLGHAERRRRHVVAGRRRILVQALSGGTAVSRVSLCTPDASGRQGPGAWHVSMGVPMAPNAVLFDHDPPAPSSTGSAAGGSQESPSVPHGDAQY